MEEEKDGRVVPNSSIEEESDSDDDLIHMENITDLDSSIEIIEMVTSSPSEVSVDRAACVRDVLEEEQSTSGDDDDDLIKMENITDLDISIEVIETVTSSLGEDDTKKPSSHTVEHVTSDTAACSKDEDDNQAVGERLVLRKCRVLVKKSKLSELGKRKEVMNGPDLDLEDEEQNAGVDTTINASLENSSMFDISFGESSAKMVSCWSSSSTPNESLPSSTGEGGCIIVNKEDKHVSLGKYDYFLEEVEHNKNSRCRKVRCLLCGDGKTIAYINLGRHIKALHEPPVKCKICQKEFNIIRLSHHMRKWHTVAEENNNVDRSDDTEDNSTPLPSVKHSTSQPDHPVLGKQLEGDIIYLTMTSASVKGVSLKMGLKKGSKIKLAMRKFGNRFKVPWTQLNFFRGDTELTGREMVGNLDGTNIKVCGPQ